MYIKAELNPSTIKTIGGISNLEELDFALNDIKTWALRTKILKK